MMHKRDGKDDEIHQKLGKRDTSQKPRSCDMRNIVVSDWAQTMFGC